MKKHAPVQAVPPVALRDSCADSSRDGSGRIQRGANFIDVPVGVATLANEAAYYGPLNQPIAGTASDHAGLTSGVHGARYEAHPGANSTAPMPARVRDEPGAATPAVEAIDRMVNEVAALQSALARRRR